MNTTLGQFNPLAIAFFLLFVVSSLGITNHQSSAIAGRDYLAIAYGAIQVWL